MYNYCKILAMFLVSYIFEPVLFIIACPSHLHPYIDPPPPLVIAHLFSISLSLHFSHIY